MAFKAIHLIPGVGKIRYLARPSTAYAIGEILKRATTAYIVSANVGAIGETNISNIEAIATKTETLGTGTVFVEAIPLQAVTYVVADCTNDTADNQLNQWHALTNSTTVSNSTGDTTTAAIFRAISIVGTAGTRKLFGYLVKGPQNV